MAALPAVLIDLSALFIAAPLAVFARRQAYNFPKPRDTTPRLCFCLLGQHLKPPARGLLQSGHGRVTKWWVALTARLGT
jgi:hypothetical protein